MGTAAEAVAYYSGIRRVGDGDFDGTAVAGSRGGHDENVTDGWIEDFTCGREVDGEDDTVCHRRLLYSYTVHLEHVPLVDDVAGRISFGEDDIDDASRDPRLSRSTSTSVDCQKAQRSNKRPQGR